MFELFVYHFLLYSNFLFKKSSFLLTFELFSSYSYPGGFFLFPGFQAGWILPGVICKGEAWANGEGKRKNLSWADKHLANVKSLFCHGSALTFLFWHPGRLEWQHCNLFAFNFFKGLSSHLYLNIKTFEGWSCSSFFLCIHVCMHMYRAVAMEISYLLKDRAKMNNQGLDTRVISQQIRFLCKE